MKLLRVLEDRVVSRLGENVWHEVDFRLLAATNRDLRALIDDGRVRRRSLRAAGDRDDRAAAAARAARGPAGAGEALHGALRRASRHAARRVRTTSARPRCGRSRRYPWPGNIRELRNVIYETLVYKRAGDELLLSDLPRGSCDARRDGRRGAGGRSSRAIGARDRARDDEPARARSRRSSARRSRRR